MTTYRLHETNTFHQKDFKQNSNIDVSIVIIMSGRRVKQAKRRRCYSLKSDYCSEICRCPSESARNDRKKDKLSRVYARDYTWAGPLTSECPLTLSLYQKNILVKWPSNANTTLSVIRAEGPVPGRPGGSRSADGTERASLEQVNFRLK